MKLLISTPFCGRTLECARPGPARPGEGGGERGRTLNLPAPSPERVEPVRYQSIRKPLVTLAVAGGQKLVDALRYQAA